MPMLTSIGRYPFTFILSLLVCLLSRIVAFHASVPICTTSDSDRREVERLLMCPAKPPRIVHKEAFPALESYVRSRSAPNYSFSSSTESIMEQTKLNTLADSNLRFAVAIFRTCKWCFSRSRPVDAFPQYVFPLIG